jgi:hypothetical protein
MPSLVSDQGMAAISSAAARAPRKNKGVPGDRQGRFRCVPHSAPFLTQKLQHAGIPIALINRCTPDGGDLVDSKFRSDGTYSLLSAEPVEKPGPDDPSDTGASLIVISLLSLGLWAAIWGTVASLASVFE